MWAGLEIAALTRSPSLPILKAIIEASGIPAFAMTIKLLGGAVQVVVSLVCQQYCSSYHRGRYGEYPFWQ